MRREADVPARPATIPAAVEVHIRRVALDPSLAGGAAERRPHHLAQAAGEALARRAEWGGAGTASLEPGLWDVVAEQIARAVLAHHEAAGRHRPGEGARGGGPGSIALEPAPGALAQ